MKGQNPITFLTLTIFLSTGLVSCTDQSKTGVLIPIAQTNTNNVTARVSGNTIVLTSDSFVAEISGTWSIRVGDGIAIEYRNKNPKPFEFMWTDFSKKVAGGEVQLSGASDLTGVDLTDSRSDNDVVKPLYQADYPSQVLQKDKFDVKYRLAPNETKKLLLSFGNFPANSSPNLEQSPKIGEEISVRFAMPSGPITVRFKRV
jgi:hypothetical protein